MGAAPQFPLASVHCRHPVSCRNRYFAALRSGQQFHKWARTSKWVSAVSFLLRAGKIRARFHPGHGARITALSRALLSGMFFRRVCAPVSSQTPCRGIPPDPFSADNSFPALVAKMIVLPQWDREYLHFNRIWGRHGSTGKALQVETLA